MVDKILEVLGVARLPKNTLSLMNNNINIFTKIINNINITDDMLLAKNSQNNYELYRLIGLIYSKKKDYSSAETYFNKLNLNGDMFFTDRYCKPNNHYFNHEFANQVINNGASLNKRNSINILNMCGLLCDYSGIDDVVEFVVKNNIEYNNYNFSSPDISIPFHYYHTIYYDRSKLFFELNRYSEFMDDIFNNLDEIYAKKHYQQLSAIISHYNYLIQQKLTKTVCFPSKFMDVTLNWHENKQK